MADNRYRRYLDEREESASSSSFLLGVANTALFAAGAFGLHKVAQGSGAYGTAVKHLAKGLGKLADKAILAEGVIAGINKTTKSSGVLKTFFGGAETELQANLSQTLKGYASKVVTGIDGNMTRSENILLQRAKVQREIASTAIHNTRLDKVLGEFKSRTSKIKDGTQIYSAFEGLLKTDTRILKAGFDNDSKNRPIQAALDFATKQAQLADKFKNSAEFHSARLDLADILKIHSNKQKFVQDNKDPIRAQIAKLNQALNSASISHANQTSSGANDTFLSKVLSSANFGMKKMTVGEAVKSGFFKGRTAPSDIATKGKNGLVKSKVDMHAKMVNAMKSIPGYADAAVDPLIFMSEGKVVDLRWMNRIKDKTLDTLSKNIQVPLIGIKPFKLISIFNPHGIDDAVNFTKFSRGSVMPTINNTIDKLKDDYFYFGGKLVNSAGDVIKDDQRLVSSRHGGFQRTVAAMSGLSTKTAKDPITKIDKIKDFLDIGNQEHPSGISKLLSIGTKFFDVDNDLQMWYNVSNKAILSSLDSDTLVATLNKAYGSFLKTTDDNVRGLDTDTLNSIKPILNGTLKKDTLDNLLSHQNEENVMSAIHELISNPSRVVRDKDKLSDYLDSYLKDRSGFTRGTRASRRGSNRLIEPGDDLISGLDEATKTLHTELLYQSQIANNKTVGQLMTGLIRDESISKSQADDILGLYTLGELKNISSSGKLSSKDQLVAFAEIVAEPGKSSKANLLHNQLERILKDANPVLGYGSQQVPPSYFSGNEFLVMGKAKSPLNPFNHVEMVNEVIKSGGDIGDVFYNIAEMTLGQMGIGPSSMRAGRGNMDKVTTLTHGAYSILFRLNEGIASVGLGLSNKNMGSTQQLYANLLGRRWVAPLAAITGASYLNYEIGNLTGEKPTQTVGRAYAEMTLDVQRIKDVTGINALSSHLGGIFVGGDKGLKNEFGAILKYGTFGLIGENRGAEELKNFYEEGYSPVRKGRFWGLGSQTPWYGGRVEYFEPSWYRQLMGEPEMTDSMYGSEAEYWAHSWLPNPRNPIGVLDRIIDPNHWENKHKIDRPFAVTGGVPELEMIPILGSPLNATLGKLIKPNRTNPDLKKAHYEYLTEINEKIKGDIATVSTALIQITPGGRITPVVASGYGGGGSFDSSIGVGEGRGSGGRQTVGTTGTYQTITNINQGTINSANIKPASLNSIAQLRENVHELGDVADPTSVAYRLSETHSQMIDTAGIYGFASSFLLKEKRPNLILQPSSDMTSYSRKFWDENLGGAGRDLSEIYRRFLPKRSKSVKTYNPIRNNQPDWLPGPEYFMDFLHGDPFCLSKDTLVDTSEGYKRAEDVNIGDLILTHKGRRLQVKDKIIRPLLESERSYSIKISNLDKKIPLEFSEGHPILIKKLNKCSFGSSCICRPDVRENFCSDKNCARKWDNNPVVFVEVKDVEIGDAVVYPIPKTFEDIIMTYNYTWRDAPRSQAYTIQGEIELTQDISWLLGLYCAEGSTAKKKGLPQRLIFSLHSEEIDVIDRTCNILYTLFGKYPIQNVRGSSTDVILCDAKAARIFNCIMPGNLYEKRIPKGIYGAHKHIKLAFILGFMVGDGTVQRNNLIGTSANKQLALDIYRLCFETGLPARYVERGTRSSFEVSIHSFHLKNLNISDLMYKSELLDFEAIRQPNIMSWADEDYIYSIITSKEEILLEHVYGFEIDEDDTFCVIGFATHNTKISKGIMRLPGAGYESINKLHSDEYFGRYGVVDRVKILGDVAPWSDQYKYYTKVASQMYENDLISESDYEAVKQQRERVTERKKKYDFTPYKFKGADIERREVTVERMIDANTFLTQEMPGVPIRLAGMKVSNADTPEGEEQRAMLAKYITVGKQVTIGIEKDATNRIQDDTMGTIHAAVYTGTSTVQRELIRTGRFKINPDEKTAAAINALYSSPEITVGKAWESFAHMDTPFHTKLLQVRSPLEMYKRNLVYGKEWQSWSNPIKDWVNPTIDKIASANPLYGASAGAAIGFLFSAGGGRGKTVGTVIGAAIGGTAASLRVSREVAHRTIGLDPDYTWIPERRERQREIEEYFDMLKYVKYKGLYERARNMAMRIEGTDPEAMFQASKYNTKLTKDERRRLEGMKRWLKIGSSDSLNMDADEARDKIKQINAKLNGMDEKQYYSVGPIAMQAIQYKQGYEETLYGADPNGDLQAIFAAMPKLDRPFFKEFLLAGPKEREEILRLVPKNQRRFYQAKWGLKQDKQESLEEYFDTHHLPGAGWAGWKPEHSLEEAKLKFLDSQALELTEYGFWEDDMRFVGENTPTVPRISGVNMIDRAKLMKVLSGAGIKNADIQISTETVETEEDLFSIQANIRHDRRKEATSLINENMINLFR